MTDTSLGLPIAPAFRARIRRESWNQGVMGCGPRRPMDISPVAAPLERMHDWLESTLQLRADATMEEHRCEDQVCNAVSRFGDLASKNDRRRGEGEARRAPIHNSIEGIVEVSPISLAPLPYPSPANISPSCRVGFVRVDRCAASLAMRGEGDHRNRLIYFRFRPTVKGAEP